MEPVLEYPTGLFQSCLICHGPCVNFFGIRLRSFNRHKTKGCWYPSSRYFVVPTEEAGNLDDAIRSAVWGDPWGQPPNRWADFEKQYEKREWEGAPAADLG